MKKSTDKANDKTHSNKHSDKENLTISRLLEGNRRFYSNTDRLNNSLPPHAPQGKLLACVITCSDPRLSPELIFDCGIGELFVIRIPGAVVTRDTLASVHIAIDALKVKNVVYMPHLNCAAIGKASEFQTNEHSEELNTFALEIKSQFDTNDLCDPDGETFVKKYLRNNSAVIENYLKKHFQDIHLTTLLYNPSTRRAELN